MRKYLLPLFVGLVIAGQLVRIPTSLVEFHQVALIPSDVGLILLAILLAFRKLRYIRSGFRHAHLAKPILLFSALAALSLAINASYYKLHPRDELVSWLYLARWVFYTLPYFLVLELIRSRNHLKTLLVVLTIGIGAFSVFGILQAVFLPNFALMVYPDNLVGWDWQRYRLVSSFMDPNLAGCLIAMALVASVACWMEGMRRSWILAAVFGSALILTYSRGALLAFLVGFLYLALAGKYKRRGFAAIMIIGLILAALLPYLLPHAEEYSRLTISDESARARIDAWNLALVLIRHNPVFGIGYGALPYVLPRFGYIPQGASAFGLDGGLLVVFALTGGLAFVAYCYVLGKVLWMSQWVSRRTGDPLFRGLAKSVFAGTLVVITSSLFTSSMFYTPIVALWWIALGMLNVVRTTVQAENLAMLRQTPVASNQPRFQSNLDSGSAAVRVVRSRMGQA